MEEPVQLVPLEEEPENVLEALAAKRVELEKNKETFIPIPGYDRSPPILMARYRLLSGPDFEGIAQRVQKQFRDRWERSLYAAIDTMLAACSGIFVDTGDGQPKPLTWKGGQVIAGFNPDLANALGFADKMDEGQTHRSVVMALFGGNEVMIGTHSVQLNRWMSNTTVEIDQDFLGNL